MIDTPKTYGATRANVLAIVDQLQQLGSAGAGAIEILAQGLTGADDSERLDAIAECLAGLATVLPDLQRAVMRARAEIAGLTADPLQDNAGALDGATVTMLRGGQ